MSEEEKAKRAVYIGGERHELTDKSIRQPSTRQALEQAQEMLNDQREGEVQDREYYTADPENEAGDRYANINEAWTDQQEKAALARERDELEAEAKAEEARRKTENEINAARNWSQEDQQLIGQLSQAAQQHEAEKQQLQQAVEYYKKNPSEVTQEKRQQLEQAAQRIQQNEEQLNQYGQTAHQIKTQKDLLAQQKKLHRDLPELADAEVKEDYLSWLEGKGITRERAMQERDPVLISRTFRQFKDEKKAERQKHLDRPRKPVYKVGALSPAGAMPSEMTIPQARERLQKGGSIHDALNLLTLQRERANEAES